MNNPNNYIVSVVNPVTLDMQIDTALPILEALRLVAGGRRRGLEWMLEQWCGQGCVLVQKSARYDVCEQQAIDTLDLCDFKDDEGLYCEVCGFDWEPDSSGCPFH